MKVPRVPFVIRVGVTGHRSERLDAARCDELKKQLKDVLTTIRDIADRLLKHAEASASRNPLFSEERPVLRLVSPLAEGADRIAARIALDLGYKLECPLPFHREAYMRDFATQGSKKYFDALLEGATVLELDAEYSEPHGNSAAYTAVGELVLRHSDVVIAVWDGQASRGGGGTAEIVEEADKRGIPVVCVDPRAERAPQLKGRPLQDWKHLLEVRLQRHLLPPLTHQEIAKSVSRFYHEKWPRLDFGCLFVLLRALFGGGSWKKVRFRFSSPADEKRARLAQLGFKSGEAVPPSHDRLVEYYIWADRLAERYAGYYRAAYPTIFLLTALSVLFALMTIMEWMKATHVGHWRLADVSTLVELVLILIILAIVSASRFGDWHRKWTDYRQLAERLRFIHVLWSLGFPESREEKIVARVGGQRSDWVPWFFWAVLRDVGMVGARFTNGYVERARKARIAELNGQITYHKHNAHELELIDERLHRGGWIIFWLTFASCLLHLLPHIPQLHQLVEGFPAWLKGERAQEVLTILAGALPALAAALFAIRSQGDFRRLAIRSAGARRAFLRQRRKLRRSDCADLGSIGEVARRSFQVAQHEDEDWREVFRRRPVNVL